MILGYGGLEILILLYRIRYQEWYTIFIQGKSHVKFRRPEIHDFYPNGAAMENLFTTSVHSVFMHLFEGDVSLNLYVPLDSWDHYVKYDLNPQDNMVPTLSISRKFSRNPNQVQHR